MPASAGWCLVLSLAAACGKAADKPADALTADTMQAAAPAPAGPQAIVTSNLDGSAPARYRQAELCFASMDALKRGTGTPAFKKVGDDFPNFVTNGLTGLIGEQP